MMKSGEKAKIDRSKVSAGISEKRLCTRCGSCSGICPHDAIWRDADYYPHLDEAKCTECGLCAAVCPGGQVSAQKLQKAVFATDVWPDDYFGHYRMAYAAHSTDEEIRGGGASGGVVTELLLYLLGQKEIDGAVVTTIDADNPFRARTIVARTPGEIVAARQSKYIVCPVNEALKMVQREKGRFAYVGLPCQIQGLRKWMMRKSSMRDKILYAIGLFCITTLETTIIEELYANRGDRQKRLQDFRFREGIWPGSICAIYHDGSRQKLHQSNFKDGAINYLTQLYSPYRCQLCTDGAAEFADLSVGDAWMRKKDKTYLYPAMSTVIVRTAAGQRLFDAARRDHRIEAHPLDHPTLYQTFRSLEKTKKKNARLRALRHGRRGKPTPLYEEPMLPVSWRDRLSERQSAIYQSLGAHKTIRRLLVRLLLSKSMIPIIFLRKKIKELRAKTAG